MEPSSVQLTPFLIAGITARTINVDEFNPATARIPALWARFFSGGAAMTIPHCLPDATIYGAYSAYESDANGHFNVTAGQAVSAPSADLDCVEVLAGRYLVFAAQGPMPAAVIGAWMAVWTYFQQHPETTRRYQSDFEAYVGVDHVKIHIGVAD
jgi:predicted transcriptional regulator YdeE